MLAKRTRSDIVKSKDPTSHMSQAVTSRLMKGFGANGFAQSVNLFIQIVTVPLFLHFWGKVLFGEWLLISTVPSYFSLSDLGFASAASNDMTMRVARGDKAGALQVFQSAWVLVTVLSLAIITLTLAVLSFVPIEKWLKLVTLPHWEVITVVAILLVQILFSMQRGILYGAYRCDGNYAAGTFINNAMRLSEFLIGAVVVWRGGSLIALAVVTLITRIVENGVMSVDIHRRSPWLHRGISEAKVSQIKELASPAIAFMGFPIGHALSLQGMLTVVGVTMGPSSVVLFSISRTLTRFIWQILNTISNTVWVELSTAFGAGDLPLARKLHRTACQAALWLAVCSSVLLYFAGPFIFRIWTHHAIAFDGHLFCLLLIVGICNSFWSTSYIVLLSVNRHQKLAAVYVAATGLALALGAILSKIMGLNGAALALLVIDMFMTSYVVVRSLNLLGDNLPDYIKMIIMPPTHLPGKLLRMIPRSAAASSSS